MLDVVYSMDNGYVETTAVSIESLLEYNDAKNVRIHILGIGLSNENIKKLSYTVHKHNGEIIFYEIKSELDKYESLHRKKGKIGMYGRLFAPKYISKDVKKVLYIDGDTIIVNCIEEIETLELGENYIAGVYDVFLPPLGVKKKLGFMKDELYINSGVFVFNLEAWRHLNLEDKCYQYLHDHPDTILNDQDAINSVCRGKVLLLPFKYNMIFLSSIIPYDVAKIVFEKHTIKFYSEDDYNEAQASPGIIHFASELFGKPWYKDSSMPYKDEWHKFRSNTLWANAPLRSRIYANNRVYSFYKMNVEKIIGFFYRRKQYYIVALLYKVFYQEMHKIQSLLRR